ncbi:MAG TPA: photosynthetic reaction center cytochrome PufC [Longimicrobium sp.]|nr:photosynthetic reaction center cytochrome PufC [Longimicrobium sp.]
MSTPMMRFVALVALASTASLAGCKRTLSVETGFRGTAQEVNFASTRLAAQLANTHIPAAIPPVPAAPPAGTTTWRNVQVLTDISPAELTRTMVAITSWVAPQQGCNYCHNPANFASDSLYTKVVARRMFQMVRQINGNWQNHVDGTGVTCYTCHAGNPVPHNVWYFTDQNQPLRHFLDRQDVRVQSRTVEPTEANRSSIKQTEYTYALMLTMSRSLGVNCTYCHMSPRWSDWSQSPPQRLTALRGIRMVRELNNSYLLPLAATLPAQRLGPRGDGPKVQCSTCHNGAYKPLYGAQMAKNYPALYAQANVAPAVQAADSAARANAQASPSVRQGTNSAPGLQPPGSASAGTPVGGAAGQGAAPATPAQQQRQTVTPASPVAAPPPAPARP